MRFWGFCRPFELLVVRYAELVSHVAYLKSSPFPRVALNSSDILSNTEVTGQHPRPRLDVGEASGLFPFPNPPPA